MPYPVRLKGQVIWTAPADEPQPAMLGFCQDHYLADVRSTSKANDLDEPPSPGEAYWRHGDTSDFLLIPELKGAIQAPTYHAMPASAVVPYDGTWTALSWGASSDWRQHTHETWRKQVAFYQPDGEVGSGYLRTVDSLGVSQGVMVWYKLLAATDVDEDDDPVQTGIAFQLGLRTDGLAHYLIDCPNHHKDAPSAAYWTITRRNFGGDDSAELVDRRVAPRPQGGRQGDPEAEWLCIIPVVGRICIASSRDPEKWWVYTRPGGAWPTSGRFAVRVYGGRAWVLPAYVAFADQSVLRGAEQTWPDELTLAGEARVVAEAVTFDSPTEHTFVGAVVNPSGRNTYPTVTITNAGPSNAFGRLRTPLVYALQEVHRTVLGVGAGGDPLDLTSFVKALMVNVQAEERGAVATLRLRNWLFTGSGYTLGYLSPLLRGVGKVTIDLAHQYADSTPDGDFVRVMTGWASRLTPAMDGIWPHLELELGDRAWLWSDGQATMFDLCDVSGWDFADAVTLILTHWGVDEADIIFPADYDDHARQVPFQAGGAGGRFDPEASILDVIDTLCERCWMRWRLRPDGKPEFRYYPEAVGSPDFVLDDDTVTPEDKVALPVAMTLDYSSIRNVARVRGITPWGTEIESRWVNQPSVIDPDSPIYTGRVMQVVRSEPDNADPVPTAGRLLHEHVTGGHELTWESIGRDLWPGDVVQVNVDHLAVAAGTLFRVTGAVHRWTSPELRWRSEFSGRIITGVAS